MNLKSPPILFRPEQVRGFQIVKDTLLKEQAKKVRLALKRASQHTDSLYSNDRQTD